MLSLLLWFVALPASAYLTTGLNERITWSLPGIPDSEILYVSRFTQGDTRIDYYYAAPLQPGRVQSIAAAITPSTCIVYEPYPDPNLCIESAGLTLTIPSFGVYGVAVSSWSVTNWGDGPGEMSLLHSDFYTHNSASEMMRIRFTGTWMPSPTNEFRFGHIKQINIYVFPIEDLYGYEGVDDAPWLKGFPDTSSFEPSVRKVPKGCGLCSRQGVPVFRVNTAVLNPVITDTDYAHESPGPDILLTRTYNADSSVTGLFGKSWSFSYESWVDSYDWGAVVHLGSGRELQFSLDTNAIVYTSPAGVSDRLSWTSSVPGRPGYGAFQYYENATRLTYQYEAPWAGGVGHPPRTNGVLLSFISDFNSNRVSLTYTNGRIRLIQDAVGRVVTLQHNASGFCTNILTPSGHALSCGYSATGNLARSVDAIGNVTDFTYDGSNSLSSMSTEGRLWQFRYVAGVPSLVAEVVDPLGYTNTYALLQAKLSNRVVTARDARGYTWRYYSKGGATWKEMDPYLNSNATAFLNGFPVSITNARGYVTTQEYDSRGNLVRRVRPDGAVTMFSYDTNGWLVAITNAVGGVTRFEYDAQGNLTRFIQPSGRETVMTYDSRGLPLTQRDPGSNTTIFTYDAWGNRASVTDPEGNISRFGFDAAGINLVAFTNARGNATQFTWDGNRRPLRMTHSDGTYVERSYDCCGENELTDELGRKMTVTRDAMLRPTVVTNPGGGVFRYIYDGNGNRTAVRDALGRTNTFTYDFANRLESAVNAVGTMTALYSYDANGNLASLTAGPIVYHWAYDSCDRPIQFDDAIYTAYMSYDPLGRMTNLVNARGQAVASAYDADGRLIQHGLAGGAVATFEYDPAGRLKTVQDAFGQMRFSRDRRGLITNVAYPDGFSVGYRYDPVGNVTQMTYPAGLTVSYTYDNRERVTNMNWGSGGIGFAYDAAGNLLREVRSNGTMSVYSYDRENRVTNILHTVGTTTQLHVRLARNLLGNVTNVVKMSGFVPVNPVFTNGQRTFEYTRPGYAETWNGNAVTYDPDGNRTNVAGATPEQATFDAENQLITLLRDGTNSAFAYNGLGQCVRTIHNGVTNHLHYDPRGNLLFITDQNAKLKAAFLYRGSAVVALWQGGGAWHTYHFDHRGNTVAMTDTQGRPSAIYRYLPYGEVASRFARVDNPLTFMGRYAVLDMGNGLFLTRTRFYDGRTGRFLSRDPAGLAGGLNLYTYGGNNPLNRVDPMGTEEDSEDGGESGGGGGTSGGWSAADSTPKKDWRYIDTEPYEDSEVRFSGINGQVEIFYVDENGQNVHKPAKMGMVIPVNAVITAREDSSCILSFADMSTYVVKSEQTVVITTPPKREQQKVKLTDGDAVNNIRKMIIDGSMEIEMNQAVTGRKG